MLLTWYKRAMIYDTTKPENAIGGAAVVYREHTFVCAHHFQEWDEADEWAQMHGWGDEVKDILQAAQLGELDLAEYEGFMTVKGFVKTREEAAKIAEEANQLKFVPPEGYQLRSEDLKWVAKLPAAEEVMPKAASRKPKRI